MTIKIKIAQSKTFEVDESKTLLENLLAQNQFVDNPCNGKGKCGKCKVRVLCGECSELTQEEIKLLTAEEIESGVRLSCLVHAQGDLNVELMQKVLEHKVLTSGAIPDFEKDSNLDGYGFAIDIGTTTVVASLIDLKNGEELSSASDINAQKHFGLDVLTRITYEYENPENGIDELQKAIVESLNDMMCKACKKAGVAQSEVRKINVAANCTMMHMLLGVDARSIGKSPYKPVFTQSKTLRASDIGLVAGEGCTLYCLPHVSSYIGADIVAGAYVCEMQKTSQNELFIDIGTNGEIVLAKGGDLYSCSCAAGPALEGMNISGGMRAATGAIEEVQIRADKIELTTIGNEKPEGICGSGILAVVRELVLTGIILKSGVFVRLEKLDDDDWRKKYISLDGTKRELVLCEEPKIVVTQSDVRQVQMAKGAILSGFMALLNEAGIGMEDLDKVYIAGQFGAHLSVDSLIGSGILPACVQDKLVYVGNSSKTGAYMTLMSKKVTSEIEELAEKINYLELSNLENYDRLYSECMKFPSL